MREYFNWFTNGGGAGVLIGVGIWLSQGGIYRPTPTPVSYWVGIGIMIVGAIIGIYGWYHGGKIIKEGNVNLIDEIKSDLIKLSACEREAVTQKAKTPCSEEIATRINNDFNVVIGKDMVTTIVTILQNVARKHNADPLIDFFKEFGDILDSNDYGLKATLKDNYLYESTRTDLAQKRIRLRMGKKKKIVTQKNIDRVRNLSYGLNSSVLLRNILSLIPRDYSEILPVVRVTLEGIENTAETTINSMLNDLENEWVINKNTLEGINSMIDTLSMLGGTLKSE